MPVNFMTEFHAMVVHFPIALLFTSFAFELAALYPRWRPYLSPAALVTLLLGTAGSALAVLSGPEDNARGVSQLSRLHESWARYTLFFFLALAAWRLWLLWRRRGSELVTRTAIAYLLLAAAGLGLLTYTGFLGGRMVYTEAIGVSRDGKLVAPPVAGRRPPGR